MSFLKVHRDRIVRVLLWLLVLLPVAGSLSLTRSHAVNQRFLDDWELAKYVVKYKDGALTLRDLCSVYMEHRPVLPRALTVAAVVMGRGDVRGENVMAFLFLLAGFGAMARLLLKHGGATIREAWLPLLISAVALFTPVQWQTLLWGDCFYAVMPGMFLAGSLLVAFQKWRWWVRCLAGALLATLATLSFASGILIWMLPLPVMLVCGAFAGRRQRIVFTAMWLAIMAVVFAVYLEVRVQRHESVTVEKVILSLPGGYDVTYDLRNEVPRMYAYGQDNENTMARNMPYFLEHPAEDLDFVRAFSGVLLVRGAATETKTAAIWAGTVLLTGLGALGFFCWRYRRERTLFPMLFALLCFGAYTPVTGLLVAVGRIWAGGVFTALNLRYHAHHPQIIVALACAAALIIRQRRTEREGREDAAGAAFCWISGGVLLGVLGMGWFYGCSMMEAWQAARFRNAAAQMLCQILPKGNWFAAWVSGSEKLTRDTVADLERVGLLKAPLVKDAKFGPGGFGPLRLSNTTLPQVHAFVGRLWKENGNWQCEGYASLPVSWRPADGILLAYRVPGGEWTAWAFTQGDGPPDYLPNAMGKDLWGMQPRDHQWPQEFMYGWAPGVAVISEPPPGSEISFWAMDMDNRQIQRIVRDRKDTRDVAGEVLESLAERRAPVDEKKER